MIINTIKFSKAVLGLFSIVLMICMVFSPQIYMQATLNGIIVWATAVLPALFPFFFLTNILTSTNLLNKFSKFFTRPLKFLFHTSKESGVVYLMSIISGYPVGAKLISSLVEQNRINKAEAIRINAFTSCSGPIFVVGTVGSAMFHDAKIGSFILVIHFISALINGIIYRNYGKAQNATPSFQLHQNTPQNALTNSIYESVKAVLIVGGYIALSFMLCAFLEQTKLLDLLIIPINFVLNIFNISPEFSKGIVLGFLEITRGCLEFSSISTLSPKLAAIFACTIISFGGLSVTLQSMAFLKKCNIKTSTFLLQKTTHALIAFVLSFVFSFLI